MGRIYLQNQGPSLSCSFFLWNLLPPYVLLVVVPLHSAPWFFVPASLSVFCWSFRLPPTFRLTAKIMGNSSPSHSLLASFDSPSEYACLIHSPVPPGIFLFETECKVATRRRCIRLGLTLPHQKQNYFIAF